jgi:hypothetical protein
MPLLGKQALALIVHIHRDVHRGRLVLAVVMTAGQQDAARPTGRDQNVHTPRRRPPHTGRTGRRWWAHLHDEHVARQSSTPWP